MKAAVKAIGVVRLDLGSKTFFNLENVYYVPSMRHNLVSVVFFFWLGKDVVSLLFFLE